MSTAKNGNYLDIFPMLLYLLVIHEDPGGRHHAVAHDLDDIAHLLKLRYRRRSACPPRQWRWP